MRIVSLVPSLTETVCDLGLQESIVGCTQFCISPSNLYRHAKVIGGTKDPNVETIVALKPDVVLVNEEENRKEDVDRIRQFANVLNTFPKSPNDVPAMLREIGAAINADSAADKAALKIEAQLERLLNSTREIHVAKKFIYFIWRNPWMVAGHDTYISRTIELLGWKNILSDSSHRYPTLLSEDLASIRADVALLSSEPFPFRKRDAAALRAEGLGPQCEIYKVDGQNLSWYGTRTIKCLEQLANSTHWLKKV